MQVVIYLQDSIEVSPYFARTRVGQEPGLHLQTLSLFCWKFSFSWKYIAVIRGKKRETDLINSCGMVAFIMERRLLREV